MTDTPARVRRGPELEQTREGRFYLWQGERYWSVTTLIGAGLPKPALLPWAVKRTALCAVDELDIVQAMAKRDRDGAVDYLERARYRSSEPKRKLGTWIHEAAEAYVLQAPYPEPNELQAPILAQFVAFLDTFAPEYVAVEAPVFSREQHYAGTLDAIVQITHPELALAWGITGRPITLLIDYKTSSSGVYAEAALQLAAYRHAETFLGMPSADEAPMPHVDGTAVLWLRPDGYSLVPVRTDADVFRSFLYVREVARFQWELSGNVVGRAVRPPGGEVVAAG